MRRFREIGPIIGLSVTLLTTLLAAAAQQPARVHRIGFLSPQSSVSAAALRGPGDPVRATALIVALALGLTWPPLSSDAQPARKVYRVGFLGAASPASYASLLEAFRLGLRDLGYTEGKNVMIDSRWAEGKYERLPGLAAELVRLKPDVLLTHGTPGTRAAKQVTTTIPIVMAVTGDPVATGLVRSLANPGGNVTGSALFLPELNAKRLEMLKEVFPHLSRVAVLVNPDNPANAVTLKAMEETARSITIELRPVEARGPADFDGAFATIAKWRAGALSVYEDAMLIAQARRVAGLATKAQVPSIGFKEYAEGGGLMAFGVDFPDLWRRAAGFVDRIFRGAKPADMPVEQPSKFEVVINLRTARVLGVTIPQALLLRADQVIK